MKRCYELMFTILESLVSPHYRPWKFVARLMSENNIFCMLMWVSNNDFIIFSLEKQTTAKQPSIQTCAYTSY